MQGGLSVALSEHRTTTLLGTCVAKERIFQQEVLTNIKMIYQRSLERISEPPFIEDAVGKLSNLSESLKWGLKITS